MPSLRTQPESPGLAHRVLASALAAGGASPPQSPKSSLAPPAPDAATVTKKPTPSGASKLIFHVGNQRFLPSGTTQKKRAASRSKSATLATSQQPREAPPQPIAASEKTSGSPAPSMTANMSSEHAPHQTAPLDAKKTTPSTVGSLNIRRESNVATISVEEQASPTPARSAPFEATEQVAPASSACQESPLAPASAVVTRAVEESPVPATLSKSLQKAKSGDNKTVSVSLVDVASADAHAAARPTATTSAASGTPPAQGMLPTASIAEVALLPAIPTRKRSRSPSSRSPSAPFKRARSASLSSMESAESSDDEDGFVARRGFIAVSSPDHSITTEEQLATADAQPIAVEDPPAATEGQLIATEEADPAPSTRHANTLEGKMEAILRARPHQAAVVSDIVTSLEEATACSSMGARSLVEAVRTTLRDSRRFKSLADAPAECLPARDAGTPGRMPVCWTLSAAAIASSSISRLPTPSTSAPTATVVPSARRSGPSRTTSRSSSRPVSTASRRSAATGSSSAQEALFTGRSYSMRRRDMSEPTSVNSWDDWDL